MGALQMFLDIKMQLQSNTEYELSYVYKNKYMQYGITFNKEIKTFHLTESNFIAKDEKTWNAMIIDNQFENEWDMHNASQGYWQAQTIVNIGIDLLEAITQQTKELGWI